MGSSLKPHSAYRDIGLPWLASLPAHWAMKRGKELFQCIDERSVSGAEELLTVSSLRGVVPRSTASVTMFKAESYVGYKLCWPDDLVINSLWAWAGGLGVSHHHGIISSAYGVYRLRDATENSPAFVHELVRSVPFQWELQVRSKGIWTSRLQLTDQSFFEAPFPIPPSDEQAAIVRYLDYMDRRIRRCIRAKQKLMKLLDEQKQVIIHQAVTGQIDVRTGEPYPAYKDSGVAWLRQVPRHWEVRRVKTICRLAYGDGLPAELREIGPYRVYGSNGPVGFHSTANTKAPCLVIGRKGSFGKVNFSNEPVFAIDTTYFVDERHSAADMRWLFYLLGQLRLDEVSRDSAIPGLAREDAHQRKVPAPSLQEQVAIARFLDEATANANDAIERVKRGIELVREYRARVIADVVTGKLDVREAAANLPDEAEEPESLAGEDLLTDDGDVDETVEEEAALEEVEA